MTLRLLPVEKSDAPTLVDIFFTTFQSPIVLALMPDVPSVREWYLKGLEDDLSHAWTQAFKVVAGGGGGDSPEEIVAFAKWTAPHEEPQDGKPAQYPEAGDAALFAEVVDNVGAMKRKLLGQQRHWYLGVIATLPQHQRKGAAGMLMAELCRRADEAGELAYVESSPMGTSTYRRFGFETAETVTTMINGEPYIDCCMVRQPRRL